MIRGFGTFGVLATLGPIFYIVLYYLLFLEDVLAHPYFLFDHRALLYHDLFLDDGYPDLVVRFLDPSLRPPGLRSRLPPAPLLDRHPLYADIFALFGH